MNNIPAKLPVLGVGISITTYDEIARVCRTWIESRAAGRYVCVTSVHGIIEARRSAAVRAALNGAAIVTPDGMPVVWAMRSFGARSQARVYGPDLMLALCAQAAERGYRTYFYGATEDTLDRLCGRLSARYPELRIAGAHSPPFRRLSPEEQAAAVCRIRDSGADLVFVGMSTPKQDRWMAETAPLLGGAVMVGVGAAFDFHAGKLRQAPSWIQQHGLEWLFRLAMEPGRLWKRYLITTPVFLPLWALQKLGLLRHDVASGNLN